MSDLQARLDQAQALAGAATPGPWRLVGEDETNESAVARSVQPGIAYDAEKSDAEFIAAARAEWPRMAAALQRVADLHQQETGGTPSGDVADVCSCGVSYWPCPTLRAIEGDEW